MEIEMNLVYVDRRREELERLMEPQEREWRRRQQNVFGQYGNRSPTLPSTAWGAGKVA
jgi:hypothetical protein